MNMNIFKRAKSKYTGANSEHPLTTSTSSLGNSPRPPLVPQTNIDLLPQLPSGVQGSSADSLNLKPSIGKKISHRTDDSRGQKPAQSSFRQGESQSPHGLAPRPRTTSRSTKRTYTNNPDDYTQNDLNTFTFGAAPAPSPIPMPVDPLFRPPEDSDAEEIILVPDTTPRPSVIGGEPPRSHQSHPSTVEDWQASFSPSRRNFSGKSARTDEELESDAASAHTFGLSSASASVSSLSRPSGSNSRATSRVSGRSSTTPQTSGNDLTSDEEDMDGRHPLPPEPQEPLLPSHFLHQDHNSSLYSSDDEFDDYTEEDGNEIESLVDGSSEFVDHERGQHGVSAAYAQRRGSAAMPILNTSSDRSYVDHREREDSVSTFRRPSRSLDELYSFSFAQGTGLSSGGRDALDHPLPPAPTSVPESEGDWRDLRKRSIQWDKELPPIVPSGSSGSTADSMSANSGQHLTIGSTTDGLGFDASWMQTYGVNGVVGFDMDEMTDIVGESSRGGRRPSAYSRKGSSASAFRRQSTVSSVGVDIIHRNIQVWGNQKYQDQRRMWIFTREKDRFDEAVPVSRTPTTFGERERPSISSFFSPRLSTTTEAVPNAIAPFLDGPKEKQKSSGKDKASKEPWKGMALDSEEIWFNGSTGRYKVGRRNTASPEMYKPPQQRLNISYIRGPYVSHTANGDVANGPAVTIHKHSRACGFSITRIYKSRGYRDPNETNLSLRHTPSRGHMSTRDPDDGTKRKSSSILLATRRVQKAFTSTTTTRKLEHHGHLDDPNRTRHIDRARRDRERQRPNDKSKERTAEKTLSDRAREKSRVIDSKIKIGNDSPKRPLVKAESSKSRGLHSSEGSSAGSVSLSISDDNTRINPSNASSTTAVTTPEQSDTTSSFGSVEQSVLSHETNSSDRTISRRRHRGSITDDLEDDDSADERRPTRTPYREAYAALPPEVFEAAHQEHPSHGLFGWGRPRGGDRGVSRVNAYLEASYHPHWPVAAPRVNSETRKGIVDDLNMSFQDVGLLPAIGEIKGSSHSGQNKRKQQQPATRQTKHNPDKILEEVPDDCLFMLLPLWPGETDPTSAKKYPFTPSAVPPVNARQYLLVYYKTPPPPVPREEPSSSKTKSGEKKRSRNSPNSSHDSANGQNEHSVLLSTFHISARVVAYFDLQGMGVRIPDTGLAVCGPLEDAYDNLPICEYTGDYVIGFCHSRDSGIEFLSEGFEKLGLSRSIPNPRPLEPTEDDDSSSLDTVSVLTPMGRAVLEMAWLGGMSLTSFNPNSIY